MNTNADPREYRMTIRNNMMIALTNMPEFQCGKD
jgi:hypothetical protein